MPLPLALLVPLLLATMPVEAFVVGAGPGGVPSDAPVQARLGEKVTLHAVVAVGRGAARRYHTAAPALVLAGRRVPASQLRPVTTLPGARFAWYQVEPEQQHVTAPARTPGQRGYTNAVLGGPRHGTWLGFDTLEYTEQALPGETGPSLAIARVKPAHPRVDVHGGLGVMRYRFEATWTGGQARAPGREATNRGGLSDRVLRVSFRSGDDLVGWLGSYFNVPYVFGSAGYGATHQTEAYQGTDCADVIVGAARRAGARMAYTNVSGLFQLARPVTGRLRLERSGLTHADGARQGQAVALRFGANVQPGDLMVIDFLGAGGLPRGWVHVAVIARDAGQAGRFDPQDRVLHMGFEWGLEDAAAGDLGPSEIQILRWRPAYQAAMKRATRRP